MKKTSIYLLLMVFFGIACSKDSNTDQLLPDQQAALTGRLFFYNHEGHKTMAFPSMEETVWMNNVTWYNWDISLDGEHILEMRDGRSDGRPDQVKFMFRRFQDDTVIKQFYYAPLRGGSIYISGRLSPDKSLFCISPTFEEGFVLLAPQEEKIMAHLENINGEKIPRNTNFCWMPDNALIVGWKNSILRFPPPYIGGELIKELSSTDFRNLAANRQGTKLAMIYEEHVWVLDIATGDMYQATESQGIEASPAFSPDGKHIILGTGVQRIGVPGSVPSYQSYLKIVPVDNNTYDVDQDENGTIPVIAAGNRSHEPLKGAVVWTD